MEKYNLVVQLFFVEINCVYFEKNIEPYMFRSSDSVNILAIWDLIEVHFILQICSCSSTGYIWFLCNTEAFI